MVKNMIAITAIICSMFSSCQTHESSTEIQNLVKDWMGKEIIFPQEVSCISMNEKIKCISPTSTPYKILVYIDSTGCTSCKLDLYKWNMLIEEVENDMQDLVNFQFYFHPKNIRELQFLFQRDRFKYPLYIDNNDLLNKLNNLPSDSRFQTFLLDKNNKVMLIGNPVNNPKIWSLFKQEIKRGKETNLSNLYNGYPITSLKVEEPVLELKKIVVNKTTIAYFQLKNIGNNPLVITHVSTACGCTVPKWSKLPILPNESTEIKVEITPDKKGYFRKSITVYCNIAERNITLFMRGIVRNDNCM